METFRSITTTKDESGKGKGNLSSAGFFNRLKKFFLSLNFLVSA